MWPTGEDTRQKLWSFLTRYVALKLPEASHISWEVMAGHVTSPSASEISEFVNAFAERLKKEAQDEEWTLDLESATQSLFTIVRTRLSDLTAKSLDTLSKLAILWSEGSHTAEVSCDLVKELQLIESKETQQIFDNWAQRILNDLPMDCIRLFATSFPSLPVSAQSETPTQLQTIISNDNIDEETGKKYKLFLDAMPPNALESEPFKSHLDNLLPQIAARHNNPHDYLYRVFPSVAKVLNYASRKPLGQALHTLFANAKGQPKHYSWLHSCMVGYWPEPSAKLKPYNPTQIFNDGHTFAVSQPTSSSSGLLKSLRDMITRELVSSDQGSALVEAACAVWKNAPDEAIDIFTGGFNGLNSDQTADLIDAIDWANEEHRNLIREAWLSIVQVQNVSTRMHTTNLLLAKGIMGTKEEPDFGLHVWLDVQGDKLRDVLSNAMMHDDLNDTHRKRLWQQAMRIGKELGPSFYLDIIPKLVVLSSIDETAAAIFESKNTVSAILGTTDNRAELSQHLIKAFPNAPTKTVKSHIAEWCKILSGDACLRKLQTEFVTEEDIIILDSHFPGASALKKLKKARKP